jgi:hypothetical protein
MKVYQILTILVVEDEIENKEIGEICKAIEEDVICDNFYISNCINVFELKETIKYPDPPASEDDSTGEDFNKWIEKSQEIIDQFNMELRNP